MAMRVSDQTTERYRIYGYFPRRALMQARALLSQAFGAGYITDAELEAYAVGEYGRFARWMATGDGQCAGLVLMDTRPERGRMGALLPAGMAYLKAVVVEPRLRGRGIAAELLDASLAGIGGRQVCTTAWVRPDGKCPAEDLLASRGFSGGETLARFWDQDSRTRGYVCAACGGPPCTCSARLFVLTAGAGPRSN